MHHDAPTSRCMGNAICRGIPIIIKFRRLIMIVYAIPYFFSRHSFLLCLKVVPIEYFQLQTGQISSITILYSVLLIVISVYHQMVYANSEKLYECSPPILSLLKGLLLSIICRDLLIVIAHTQSQPHLPQKEYHRSASIADKWQSDAGIGNGVCHYCNI